MKVDQMNYLVTVPPVVYQVYLIGGFHGSQISILLIGIAVIMGATLVSLQLGRYWRLRAARPVLVGSDFKVSGPGLDERTLLAARFALYREPLWGALHVAAHWTLGSGFGLLLFWILDDVFQANLGRQQYFAVVYGGIIVSALPGFLVNYLLIGQVVAAELRDPVFESLPEQLSQVRMPGLRLKIAMALVCCAWYPLTILGYNFYASQAGLLSLQNAQIHVFAVAAMVFILIALVVFLVYRELSSAVDEANRVIAEMAAGRLDTHAPVVSADELGGMNENLNRLSRAFRGVIASIRSESDGLKQRARDLTRDMHDLSRQIADVASAVDQMSASIEELAASSDSVAENVKRQNENTERTHDDFRNLHLGVLSISEDARAASEEAGATAERATRGEELLGETQKRIGEIGERTRAVVAAVNVINEIADQVNLLALNASIEAARAGESGRGFAVVAHEVSRLADRTQSNASEVLRLINEAVASVSAGVKSVEATSGAFGEILVCTKRTVDTTDGINSEAISQSRVSKDVAKNFDLVRAMSEEIATYTREQGQTRSEFLNTVNSVSENAQMISQIAGRLNELANGLSETAENLGRRIEFFQAPEMAAHAENDVSTDVASAP
ncbi:MAG: methyl-accepting chemotaxis protein [bacterium]|nr:methyl-accepting chemotaxis protein [bacterium]